MQKFVNITTTLFGLFLIGYVWYLVPYIDKFDSMDGLIGTFAGMVLIMFQNARMKDTIYTIIDKLVTSKSGNITKNNE